MCGRGVGVGSSRPRLRTKQIATPHCPLDEAPGNEPNDDEGSYRGPHGVPDEVC